ncbi:phenazine biosynthesis protein PhzF family [Muriicola jejuensis]|uniref:PhzF family phenazine biosynthesis isomerase n=1 Tax=Muriicola jejuensis TaxID=504488 RepID=A0A6P0UDL7_9FLAO|nr:PhzF family phenazine biosynthesis protein [Muriicola jejuensis]NER09808.1 PhzF family phenazine biosynthesis isomerase [Muriicola jejuensis]SMP05596.1 phenazine biosynthesis protein PhzF family [Muriicola jejuensis]
MKTLQLFQINAFASSLFKGNPAAVCVLDSWLNEQTMQDIAMENNLAETAFVVKREEDYHIRWFTPEVEVDLCGHATLAAAWVLFHRYGHEAEIIHLHSDRSGPLSVKKEDSGELTLDFPVDTLEEVGPVSAISEALGKEPLKVFRGKTDYLLIYENEQEIIEIVPNFFLLDRVDARGVIVTAPGKEVDFVSRFFAPKCGVPEDPVTGSAHTSLTPYWAKVLGKADLKARQLSKRGGSLRCRLRGERVWISGSAVPYLKGEITL